jgi:hypothetical protein
VQEKALMTGHEFFLMSIFLLFPNEGTFTLVGTFTLKDTSLPFRPLFPPHSYFCGCLGGILHSIRPLKGGKRGRWLNSINRRAET